MGREVLGAEESLILFSFSPSLSSFLLSSRQQVHILNHRLEVELLLCVLTKVVKIMDASEGEQHEVLDHLIICIIHSCLPWEQILREEIHRSLKEHGRGFPGGSVVKNPPANAGDTGARPGLGRSNMPRSN